MSEASKGRQREYNVRDRLVAAGYPAIMRAAASKGAGDLLHGHPFVGAVLVQVGTGKKSLNQEGRDRFCEAADLIGALPVLATVAAGPGAADRLPLLARHPGCALDLEGMDALMSADTLFPISTAASSMPPAKKWTERMMLDLLRVRYGQRAGNGERYVLAEHVRNQCGFGGYPPHGESLRTADALAVDLWPSNGHLIHGFEVKVSRSDWLHELKDPEKAEAFRPYCDHWWLVVPDVAIVRDDLPAGWGLLAPDGKGSLRVRRRAPKLTRQPMPFGMTAAWLRAAAKPAIGTRP